MHMTLCFTFVGFKIFLLYLTFLILIMIYLGQGSFFWGPSVLPVLG